MNEGETASLRVCSLETDTRTKGMGALSDGAKERSNNNTLRRKKKKGKAGRAQKKKEFVSREETNKRKLLDV